ncbi:MAG: SPOR domain-containing protein [Pseudomonadota bacterium]
MAPSPVSSPARRGQRGGTLLGFMLGLVVGIGAALAVAVYVTKVPIPLVDRGVQRKPTQPETEAQRLRQWNPNAGLSAAKPEGAPSAANEPPANVSEPARSSAPAEAADPIAELIRQRTASAQPAAGQAAAGDAPVDPFQYFVQVGAFRSAEEAEAQRARLALQGFDAKVSEREQAGQRMYRVRLGPFGNKVDAEVMQERLRAKQIETALVRVQR